MVAASRMDAAARSVCMAFSPESYFYRQRLVPPPSSSLARSLWLDRQFRGESIELRQQFRRQRQAVGLAVGDTLGALIARQTHRVIARQRLGIAQAADVAIDLGLELVERLEAAGIERQHELPGVGGRRRIGVEVDAVAAEQRAVERAREQTEHQRQT